MPLTRRGWLTDRLRIAKGDAGSASGDGCERRLLRRTLGVRGSAWTILPTRLEARRRLGFDCRLGCAAEQRGEGLAARVRGGGG